MAESIGDLNWLAIALATLSTFFIGSFWYSPFLFSKAWMAENGFTDADLEGRNMVLIFGLALVLSFVMALDLAFFIGPDATAAGGAAAGAAAGIGWVAAAIGIVALFERKSLRYVLINAGYLAVAFTVMGGILGMG